MIKAGGVHDGIIYIFRGGKQWKFDNRPKEDKPFGDLINGGYRARTNWTDIHFPGGVGSHLGGFIMIYRNKWSKWMRENKGPSNGDLRDLPIGEREAVDPELDNTSDLGALALVDPKKHSYRKIKGSLVCPLKIKDNHANWEGQCKPVGEEEHNYPPEIIAAIKTSEQFWYLVNKEGKYCRRKESKTEEVFPLNMSFDLIHYFITNFSAKNGTIIKNCLVVRKNLLSLSSSSCVRIRR